MKAMKFISNLLSRWGVGKPYNELYTFVISLVIVFLLAYLAHILFKIYLSKQLNKYLEKKSTYIAKSISESRLVHRFSHLVPAIIIYRTISFLNSPSLSIDTTIIRFIEATMLLYILIACVLVFNSIVSIIETIYKYQKGSKRRSIKSYLQIIRILIYLIAIIVAVSVILNKSPLVLFTGLGALVAVYSFVFKDTILGFVASVQLASYDMVREGDWIVMPKYGADGDVIEISLNTVKIQNFDKTITTVPTASLLTEGVTNWRGMEESGSRRIKRSFNIDIDSIKFCDDVLYARLSKIEILKEYIKERQDKLEVLSIESEDDDITTAINEQRLTNTALFRAYLRTYLRNHPHLHKERISLIRYLDPNELGLPLEIYVFTNVTQLVRYESIQSDLFDHILASAKVFDIDIYQR
jgi:miniconductance mechanosensitive channel